MPTKAAWRNRSTCCQQLRIDAAGSGLDGSLGSVLERQQRVDTLLSP